jgi:hypothetical protein
MVYFETMSISADQNNVACHALVHHKTRTVCRIVRTLRTGTIQEREKRRVTIINNKSDILEIYLMTYRKKNRKEKVQQKGNIS